MSIKKILLALPELKEGGVERHVFDLATELRTRNYTVGIVAKDGAQAEKFYLSGAQIFNLPVNSKRPCIFITTLSKVKSVVNSFKPDIIHVHSRVPAWHLWFAKGRVPFVTTCHGKYKQNFLSNIMYKGTPTIGVSNYCLADTPVALKAKYNQSVVYNGINLQPIDSIDKNKARNRLSEFCDIGGRYIIGTVARLTKLKRVDVLIKAVANISSFPYKLVVIGSGPELDNLNELVGNLSIQNNVLFIGARMDLTKIVPAFDVFVNPCPVEGGTSYSVLEAMDLLVPCIGANSGGLAELIQHNYNGFNFTPNNPIDLFE